MRRKLTGFGLCAIVALTGFAVASLGTGVAATTDTVTTTGTTGTTDTSGTTTVAGTTTNTVPSTVTVTVTVTVSDTVTTTVPSKVLLCHRTRAAKRPWVLVRVASTAVAAHLKHGDKAPTNGSCAGLNAAAKQHGKSH
jgi:hypothetical protein